MMASAYSFYYFIIYSQFCQFEPPPTLSIFASSNYFLYGQTTKAYEYFGCHFVKINNKEGKLKKTKHLFQSPKVITVATLNPLRLQAPTSRLTYKVKEHITKIIT